jgi:predicted PurR-regulated permease PerM
MLIFAFLFQFTHGKMNKALLSRGKLLIMTTVLIICVIIVLLVLLLTILTTNKAYNYEHKIDPLDGPNNPKAAPKLSLDEQQEDTEGTNQIPGGKKE